MGKLGKKTSINQTPKNQKVGGGERRRKKKEKVRLQNKGATYCIKLKNLKVYYESNLQPTKQAI